MNPLSVIHLGGLLLASLAIVSTVTGDHIEGGFGHYHLHNPPPPQSPPPMAYHHQHQQPSSPYQPQQYLSSYFAPQQSYHPQKHSIVNPFPQHHHQQYSYPAPHQPPHQPISQYQSTAAPQPQTYSTAAPPSNYYSETKAKKQPELVRISFSSGSSTYKSSYPTSYTTKPTYSSSTPSYSTSYSPPTPNYGSSTSSYGSSSSYTSSDYGAGIVTHKQNMKPGNSHEFEYSTTNGITHSERTYLKHISSNGPSTTSGGWGSTDNRGDNSGKVVLVKEGYYSYISPEGQPISLSYHADENGFKAVGAHLPVPPQDPNYQHGSHGYNGDTVSVSSSSY